MSIYVEILIRGPVEEIWTKTQVPEHHEAWDLRFTRIEYLQQTDDQQPQQFRYTTRLGFLMSIEGEGETVGSRNEADGSRTSALKFWSSDRRSLITEGVGYWRYETTGDGVRFLTSYDYRVRYGAIGRCFDLLVFRLLIGWATAWSFDRLRLWVERDIHPALSIRFAMLHFIATAVIGFVWIYHGAVPKLLFGHPDEIEMLSDAGIPSTIAAHLLKLIGGAEIALGVIVILYSRMRWPFVLTIAVMLLTLAAVTIHSPARLFAAFNPVSLNLLMMAAATVGLISSGQYPSSRRCLRERPGRRQ